MMDIILFIFLWLFIGALSYPIHFGWYYYTADRFPTLGSRKQQWKKSRREALITVLFMTFSGPAGLLTSLASWYMESEKRLKFTWEG